MKKLLLILLACFVFSVSAFAAPVNLNTATAVELEALNGVGPVKAKAIVDYRVKNGDFKSVDDLEKVTGFGKKTVDSLRADLIVSAGAKSSKVESKTKVTPDAKKDDSKKAADKK